MLLISTKWVLLCKFYQIIFLIYAKPPTEKVAELSTYIFRRWYNPQPLPHNKKLKMITHPKNMSTIMSMLRKVNTSDPSPSPRMWTLIRCHFVRDYCGGLAQQFNHSGTYVCEGMRTEKNLLCQLHSSVSEDGQAVGLPVLLPALASLRPAAPLGSCRLEPSGAEHPGPCQYEPLQSGCVHYLHYWQPLLSHFYVCVL